MEGDSPFIQKSLDKFSDSLVKLCLNDGRRSIWQNHSTQRTSRVFIEATDFGNCRVKGRQGTSRAVNVRNWMVWVVFQCVWRRRWVLHRFLDFFAILGLASGFSVPGQQRFSSTIFSVTQRFFQLCNRRWCLLNCDSQHWVKLFCWVGQGQISCLCIEAGFVQVTSSKALIAVELHQVEDLLLCWQEQIFLSWCQTILCFVSCVRVNVDWFKWSVGQVFLEDRQSFFRSIWDVIDLPEPLASCPEVNVFSGKFFL